MGCWEILAADLMFQYSFTCIHQIHLSTYFVHFWMKQNAPWKQQTTGRLQAWILEHETISQWPLYPKVRGFLSPLKSVEFCDSVFHALFAI